MIAYIRSEYNEVGGRGGRVEVVRTASELVLVRPDGSGERVLRRGRDFVAIDTAAAEQHGRPVWSPNGTEILVPAYHYDRDGDLQESYTLTVHVETGRAELLALPAWEYSWSPDGQRLAFASTDLDRDELVVETVKPDGTDRTLVVRLQRATGWGSVDWSPAGTMLAFIRCPSYVADSPAGMCHLVTVSASGAGLRKLAPVGARDDIGNPDSVPPGPSWAKLSVSNKSTRVLGARTGAHARRGS
jgi:dipeptidyl aminopeptidase/acylaminoacyl peptidase